MKLSSLTQTSFAGALTVPVSGEDLLLLPQRAIFWARRRTLILSDLHIGKTQTFRGAGLPMPEALMDSDLRRLKCLLEAFQPERVLLIGDLFHASANSEVTGFFRWREMYPGMEFILVKGNHDRVADEDLSRHGILPVAGEFRDGPFLFSHFPLEEHDGYLVHGHIHPVYRMTGKGKQSLTLPCFVVGEQALILPAFGEFTGGARHSPSRYEQVFLITETAVLRGTPSALSRP